MLCLSHKVCCVFAKAILCCPLVHSNRKQFGDWLLTSMTFGPGKGTHSCWGSIGWKGEVIGGPTHVHVLHVMTPPPHFGCGITML